MYTARKTNYMYFYITAYKYQDTLLDFDNRIRMLMKCKICETIAFYLSKLKYCFSEIQLF